MGRHIVGLVCVLMVVGCSDNPSGPGGEPVVFQGTVVAAGSVWHTFAVTEYGGVRVELEDVSPRLAGTTDVLDQDLTMGFGLGEPEDGECVTTFRSSISEGDHWSFGLGEDVYCFLMFDSGGVPDDVVVDYTLVVTP